MKTLPLLTIVIPAYNEEGNIAVLIQRLHSTLTNANIPYAVILVDDRSTDKTVDIAKQLALKYPLTVLRKQSNISRGKAQSLITGFIASKSEFVAMLDADLQYAPEEIPTMVNLLREKQADIIIADRISRKRKGIRYTASQIFRTIFGKLLFGFDYDVQSGLKVFRRKILDRLVLKPQKWMFDLEFLVRAREAGYHILSHPITFYPRHSGNAKIDIITASLEMALASIRLKYKKSPIIPFHSDGNHLVGEGFHYRGQAYHHHTKLSLKEMAFRRMNHKQKIISFIMTFVLFMAFLLDWQFTLIVIIAFLTCLYFIDLFFSWFLLIRSSMPHEILLQDSNFRLDTYPTYTIFCPLYKEWRVIPQFIKAMTQLQYPKNKLQVMLLLEEDDRESIEQINRLDLPSFIEVRVVPHAVPKTKPKALNFGLHHAKGEYAVIYDAEDIPEPNQLVKAIEAFNKYGKEIICVQAKLNFYNPYQNIVTKFFTAEYTLWFDMILPGLQSIGAPIPLGGTSNHFRVEDLRKLGGWDAFNVTEDADLGMRIAKRGYKTAVVDSTTMEEANSKIIGWHKQRSRWIKGYIQTYLVHMRAPGQFAMNLRKPDFILFQLIIGGKVLSLFINPLMWLITVSYFSFRSIVGPTIESFYPAPVLYMGVICLVFGNFFYLYSYMVACAKKGFFPLIEYTFLIPFYWLSMSVAAWMAVYDIIRRPHYWSKTVHGFHLSKTKKRHKLLFFQRYIHIFANRINKTNSRLNVAYLPDYCDILQQS